MWGYDTDRRQTFNVVKRGVCDGEHETVREARNTVCGTREGGPYLCSGGKGDRPRERPTAGVEHGQNPGQ